MFQTVNAIQGWIILQVPKLGTKRKRADHFLEAGKPKAQIALGARRGRMGDSPVRVVAQRGEVAEVLTKRKIGNRPKACMDPGAWFQDIRLLASFTPHHNITPNAYPLSRIIEVNEAVLGYHVLENALVQFHACRKNGALKTHHHCSESARPCVL